MKKLHTYVLKHWPFYLLALISMFIAIGLDMLYPQITKVIVNEVFNNYTNYDGGVILLGVIFYCIQLYCDFSGGIDITRAVAKMFGIELIDNFKRPIFATSLADFWRRWHISLGTWMKDYLFYPLSLSKSFIKLRKMDS